MTAAPPLRDSVLDAVGYAVRVLRKPAFLWAPVVIYVILLLPLLGLPGTTGETPTFATRADVDAYIGKFVPVIIGSLVLGIILGPLASAVMYRLARQYVDGEPPEPFAPGIVGLAARFFVQTLVFLLLVVFASFAWVIAFAVLQGTVGIALAAVVTVVGGFLVGLYAFLRLGLAPVLLLSGAGPIESIGQSWELTRGHLSRVFRWVVVSGLIIGIAGFVVSGSVGALFGAVGQTSVGQYLGTLLVAPLGVVNAIVMVLLARLLSSPVQASPPPPALPDWMQQRDPAAGSPPGPSNEGT